jgi:hypothetical protein
VPVGNWCGGDALRTGVGSVKHRFVVADGLPDQLEAESDALMVLVIQGRILDRDPHRAAAIEAPQSEVHAPGLSLACAAGKPATTRPVDAQAPTHWPHQTGAYRAPVMVSSSTPWRSTVSPHDGGRDRERPLDLGHCPDLYWKAWRACL